MRKDPAGIYRDQQKHQAILDRGGYNACKCDLCGQNRGVEYHEIVGRQQTVNNPVALHASYAKEVCAVLCRDCHKFNLVDAHNPTTGAQLLAKNSERYGYGRVYQAFSRVERLAGRSGIEFPEESNG